MSLKWQEVAVALGVVLALVVARHLPWFTHLPLARVTGIVCFSYAMFLSLRLIQSPQAVSVGEWSELRPSLVEKFGAAVLGGLSLLIVWSQLFSEHAQALGEQRVFYATLATLFGAGAVAIAFTSFFVEVRWNQRQIEHKSTFGRKTTIAWSEVADVIDGWQAITIRSLEGRCVTFSAHQAGASELAERARQFARRNRARLPANS